MIKWLISKKQLAGNKEIFLLELASGGRVYILGSTCSAVAF